jgi:hypothetical protein
MAVKGRLEIRFRKGCWFDSGRGAPPRRRASFGAHKGALWNLKLRGGAETTVNA